MNHVYAGAVWGRYNGNVQGRKKLTCMAERRPVREERLVMQEASVAVVPCLGKEVCCAVLEQVGAGTMRASRS